MIVTLDAKRGLSETVALARVADWFDVQSDAEEDPISRQR